MFLCVILNINNVLSIISYSVAKEKYELDFAMFEYDSINEQQYKEAITEGMPMFGRKMALLKKYKNIVQSKRICYNAYRWMIYISSS